MLESILNYLETIRHLPWDSWNIITLLIVAGFFVGFINTLAGTGSVITYGLFSFLGLPLNQVNGTIRLGVVVQTIVSSFRFFRHNLFEFKTGLILAIPTVLGAFLGAKWAIQIEPSTFKWILFTALLVILCILFFKPKTQSHITCLKKWQLIGLRTLVFFAIGIYGGLIHMGIGIFLILAIQLLSEKDMDLLHANALKVFIVMFYTPCALLVYILNHQVEFYIGGVSMIGNIIGCYVASSCALRWGSDFIKWVLAIVIISFMTYLIFLN